MRILKKYYEVYVEDILIDLPGFIEKSRAFRNSLRKNPDPAEIAVQFQTICDDWQKAVRAAKNVWGDMMQNPKQAKPEVRRRLCRYLVRFLWKTQGIRSLQKRLDAIGCDEEKLGSWRQAYGRKYPAMMAAAMSLADYADAYTDLAFSSVRFGSVYASPDRMNRGCPETPASRNYPFIHADDGDNTDENKMRVIYASPEMMSRNQLEE